MSVGQPLPATVRARLEHGFGVPLANVRVDTSPTARAAAAAIGARAYTEGERITLGHGESEHDLRLMAHETTHVVQNRRSGTRRPADGGGVRRDPPQGPAGCRLGFRRQPDLPHAGWPDDRIAGRHDGRRSPRVGDGRGSGETAPRPGSAAQAGSRRPQARRKDREEGGQATAQGREGTAREARRRSAFGRCQSPPEASRRARSGSTWYPRPRPSWRAASARSATSACTSRPTTMPARRCTRPRRPSSSPRAKASRRATSARSASSRPGRRPRPMRTRPRASYRTRWRRTFPRPSRTSTTSSAT